MSFFEADNASIITMEMSFAYFLQAAEELRQVILLLSDIKREGIQQCTTAGLTNILPLTAHRNF